MRKQKIHTWNSELKSFEREHLKDEGIKSLADLEESIKWQKQFTLVCKECQRILNQLKGETK